MSLGSSEELELVNRPLAVLQVDMRGMLLQTARTDARGHMQSYLTRTSAPAHSSAAKGTPSAPTTPITSPIHPESGDESPRNRCRRQYH